MAEYIKRSRTKTNISGGQMKAELTERSERKFYA